MASWPCGPPTRSTLNIPRNCSRAGPRGYTRAHHIVRFKEANLFGRLIKRMVVGNKVVDQEVVTRTFAEGTGRIDVIAIYEVKDDKIANAWFILGSPVLDAQP